MAFKFKGIGINGRKSKPVKVFTENDVDIELTSKEMTDLNRRIIKKRSEKESYGYCGIVCCTSSKKNLKSTSIWKHLK